ncbi:MAG: restriction endonuclease subunit S, partial [Oscillospiraceae bacterium]|nr:restriction endonuclease subunit S [Oscillospiraceae bacterium]
KMRLPEFRGEWERVRLGKIADNFQYGLNSSSKEYDGENKYLRITDIDEESRSIIYSNLTSPNCTLSNDYKLRKNDLLFARTGASVGKTYLYNPNDDVVYFAGYLIRCNITDACSRYVFYVTLSGKYNKWVQVMSQRSGQPGINAEEYQMFSFLLPPIAEQQAIAEVLTTADREIKLLKKDLEQHKLKKKYLMQQLLTGKIRVKGATKT